MNLENGYIYNRKYKNLHYRRTTSDRRMNNSELAKLE